ncbi:MAG: outer membrane protein assembly factor BamD [Planctomycetes bacterium]|nr:outer membrane protein assembly factor BamD [Planctomycetota bacterium]
MKKLLSVFTILFVSVSFYPEILCAKLIWSKETGWVDPETLPKETDSQLYRYAITLIVNKEYISAIGVLNTIIKKHPDSEIAEEARLKMGRAYHMLGDYKAAFNVYEQLLEQDRGSRKLKVVLAKEFQVGIAQMKRDERGAIKVFERIIELNPLGFTAADAQVKIADCYYQMSQFENAKDAYNEVLENYSNSEWVPYAQFRIPYCKLSNIRIQERNYELLDQSRDGFQEYLANNPQGSLVPSALKIIEEIDIARAERDYRAGEFYLRQKRQDAGAIYFESVIKEFPDTEWADLAREKLAWLRSIEAIGQ